LDTIPASGSFGLGLSKRPQCDGECGDCANASRLALNRVRPDEAASPTTQGVRREFRRLQSLTGVLLLFSSAVGTYLLATDPSLWLLAVSHAIGLVIIVFLDLVLGLYSLASSKSAYLPSIAAAFLGFVLQLGDIFTAPQYGMTIPYFASYLFGLRAFDLLLGLQLFVVMLGVAGRPQAQYLARRKTRAGRELDYTRRSFIRAFGALAGLVGVGVLLGSVKLPAPVQQGTKVSTTTAVTSGAGSIANVNLLRVGTPVYFDYPAGYPNALVKNSDGSLTAVSMLCTHVCCQCNYDATSKVYYCPCHGSVFDLAGRVINGPASTDLPTIQLKVDGSGNVFPVGVSNPGPCQV